MIHNLVASSVMASIATVLIALPSWVLYYVGLSIGGWIESLIGFFVVVFALNVTIWPGFPFAMPPDI